MSEFKLRNILKEYNLYEGLIYTLSSEKSVSHINYWSTITNKIRARATGNTIAVKFYDNPTEDELESLLQLTNNLGWFPASYIMNRLPFSHRKFDINDLKLDMKSCKLIHISFDAKFDKEIDRSLVKFLYHITDKKFEEKINEIGLIPKTLSRMTSHPDRIYFVADVDKMKDLLKKFNYKTPVVYKIDVGGLLKHNDEMRFFEDPRFEGGLYTRSNVPPKFLQKIDIASFARNKNTT